MDKEQQHMIPKCYLKAWLCPNPPSGKLGQMWVIQKDDRGDEGAEIPPKKYFRERDRYTLAENGSRNLAVENALGLIERDFGEVLGHLQARQPLTGRDRVVLSFFVAAMMVRTDHMPGVVGNILRTIQRQAAKQAAKANIEPSYSNAIAKSLPSLKGDTVRDGIIENSKMPIQMHLSIFMTADEAGFVTGDEPSSICVPGEWSAFIGHPDVELTMPLSPMLVAYYSWKIPPTVYANWDQDKVDRLNSRTLAGCQNAFVSWKGIVRDEWFVVDLPSAPPKAP
jgi:hypothetical protein